MFCPLNVVVLFLMFDDGQSPLSELFRTDLSFILKLGSKEERM
jgi:hypothetical protein